MLDRVGIVNGIDGNCFIQIRNGTGHLEYETLREILETYPDSFDEKDLRELLGEVLSDIVNDVILVAC